MDGLELSVSNEEKEKGRADLSLSFSGENIDII